jgi:hypothetical protein
MAESFFATLECELLERRRFKTQAEARMAVFAFRHAIRKHSTSSPGEPNHAAECLRRGL